MYRKINGAYKMESHNKLLFTKTYIKGKILMGISTHPMCENDHVYSPINSATMNVMLSGASGGNYPVFGWILWPNNSTALSSDCGNNIVYHGYIYSIHDFSIEAIAVNTQNYILVQSVYAYITEGGPFWDTNLLRGYSVVLI